MTKRLVPHKDGAQTHTHWLDNAEKTRLRQESKSPRPAPSKGIASKNRKKSQRMTVSLHLPTRFTFIRQHKATPKGKKTIHIYKNCTRHLLGMHLNSTVALRGWKVYWKHSPCTYTYIHISRAVKLPNVANICLLPFHVVCDRSGVEHEVPALPLLWSSSACPQLSVWLSLGWEKNYVGTLTDQECCIHLHSRATQWTLLDGIMETWWPNVSKDRLGGRHD